MKSLSQGMPLIGWPLAAKQEFNAKMLLEELGVCVVLARGVHSAINKEDVTRTINVVLDKREGGKGEDMMRKASELGILIRASGKINKGYSNTAMNDFLINVFSGVK
ncbi:hypothetical protein Hanom_Chr10g00902331 [Helianthus anomalus]